MNLINKFRDKYLFLSNFYRCSVYFDGLTYSTLEHAYQAQKSESRAERAKFSITPPPRIKNLVGNSPAKAKKMGHKLKLRKDWEQVKCVVMLRLVLVKFLTHPSLAKKLLATGNTRLEGGNNWGDKYWGTVDGEGKNYLGNILMGVRDILRTFVRLEHDRTSWTRKGG